MAGTLAGNLADALAAKPAQPPSAAVPESSQKSHWQIGAAPAPSRMEDQGGNENHNQPTAATMSNLADALGAKAAQKPLSSSSSSSPPASTARNTAAAAGVDSPVPVVDFAAFAAAGEGAGSNDEEAKKRAARQIDDALRTVGFVYLRNHGVDAGKVKEMFEWVCVFSLNSLRWAVQRTSPPCPTPPEPRGSRGEARPGLRGCSCGGTVVV